MLPQGAAGDGRQGTQEEHAENRALKGVTREVIPVGVCHKKVKAVHCKRQLYTWSQLSHQAPLTKQLGMDGQKVCGLRNVGASSPGVWGQDPAVS